MTRTKQKTSTPKRRFPEFRDAPGWDEARLGDQGDFLSSLTGKTAKDFDTGDASFIPYMNVFSNPFTDTSDLRSVDVAEGETQHAVAKGDVFFTVSSETQDEAGMTSVLLQDIENTYLNSFCALFRFDDGKSPNPGYLGYFLRSKVVRDHMGRGSQGATRYNISKGTFRDTPLLIPDPAEQQKIADCLGSLDDWIAAAGRKLAALRDHKRGLMQQLFPQPGQSQPQQRFPEFRDKGSWGEAPLGKLLSRKPEYGVNAAAVPFSDNLPLYIRITDIDDDGHFTKDNRVSVDIDATEENYLEQSDIVLARTGASVGKSYRYRQEDGRLVFAGFLIRVRPNQKKIKPEFLANYLTTWQYWDWVRVNSARSGQPGINGSEFASMPVPLPPAGPKGNELAEQQMIAACLTALDNQITAQADQIESLRQHKRGLMQQLFPSPDEGGQA